MRQEQVQEDSQIVSPAKRDGLLLKDGLQVFLSALLCVEACRVVVGVLSRPQLPAGGGEIALGLLDPLKGERIYRALRPSPRPL